MQSAAFATVYDGMSRSRVSYLAPNLREALRPVPVLATMDDSTLRIASAHARWVEVGAGELLVTTGQAREIFALVEGVVRIYHALPDGRQLLSSYSRGPLLLGALEAALDRSLATHVLAMGRAQAVALDAADFMDAVEASPDAMRALLAHACSEGCLATQAQSALLEPLAPRLAQLLLQLAQLFGRPVDEGVRIQLPLTQEILANDLGASPRSIRRILCAWRGCGLIASHKGWLVLRDAEALATVHDEPPSKAMS